MEDYDTLSRLTDDEIIARINGEARQVDRTSVNFWLRELDRHRSARSAQRAERLTAAAVWLTAANFVVAVIATVAAVLALAAS